MAIDTKVAALDPERVVAVKGPRRSMRPSECRTYMRKTLTNEFEEIVAGFVEAAKKGGCQHVKLATELLKPLRKSPKKKKGPVTKYWEQLEREHLVKERAEQEQLA